MNVVRVSEDRMVSGAKSHVTRLIDVKKNVVTGIVALRERGSCRLLSVERAIMAYRNSH